MKGFDNFSFYDFASLLVPGALTLYGLALLYPDLGLTVNTKGFALGALGLFVVLAYSLGHIVAAAGNLLSEHVGFWRRWGGEFPTDEVRRQWRSEEGNILASEQVETLKIELQRKLHFSNPIERATSDHESWLGITRQVYAAVAAAGQSGRVDTFNGIYGLSRGLATSLLLLSILTLIHGVVTYGSHSSGYWGHHADVLVSHAAVIVALLIGARLALFRMNRFARYYARELFVQYLQLSIEPAKTPGDAAAEGDQG